MQASLIAGSYAAVPETIHAIANGDGIAAARTVLAAIPPPGGGYGLIYGVFCREDAALTDPAAALAAARQALPDLPVEVLSLAPQAPRLFDECAIWDVDRADAAVQEPTRGNVPVLLLTGTFDAVTPPSQADEAAATPARRVVRFPGLGHDIVGSSGCGRQIMADFLNRPEGYQTRCADEMRPPTFIG